MEVIGYKEIRNELTRIRNRLEDLIRKMEEIELYGIPPFRRSTDETLLKSIESGDMLTVQKLVNSENVNRELEKEVPCWFGKWRTTTALHEAVRHGQVSIVEYLLQVGADVEKKDSAGRTALDVAVEEEPTRRPPWWRFSSAVTTSKAQGRKRIIELLCQYTRKKDAEILYLIREGYFNELKKLVNSENVNRELEKKEYSLFRMRCTTTTALHEAVRYNQVSIVEYLFQVGADGDKEDSDGITALDVAVMKKSTLTSPCYFSSAVTTSENKNFSYAQNKRIIELLFQYTRKKDAEILYLIRKGCFNELKKLVNSENVNRELDMKFMDFITWNQAKTNCHSHATTLNIAKRFGHVSFNRKRLYNSKHCSKIKPKDRWKGSKQMFDTEVDEDVLLKKCWFPFGLHSLVVGPGGGDFPLDCGDSLLEVPVGAFEKEVVIRYGIALHGPWELPEGYTPCSVTVYLNLQGHHPNKELTLHLSNWYGGKERDGVRFVRAPHILKEGESKYQFTLLEEGDFSDVKRGKLKIGQPLCLYVAAFEDLQKGNQEMYQMSATQKVTNDLDKDIMRLVFTPSSKNWAKVTEDVYEKSGWVFNCPKWKICDLAIGKPILVTVTPESGDGWFAYIEGPQEVEIADLYKKFSDVTSLKRSVEGFYYPPKITCVVRYDTAKFILTGANDLHVQTSALKQPFIWKIKGVTVPVQE